MDVIDELPLQDEFKIFDEQNWWPFSILEAQQSVVHIEFTQLLCLLFCKVAHFIYQEVEQGLHLRSPFVWFYILLGNSQYSFVESAGLCPLEERQKLFGKVLL